jgi:hypothetical protein
MFCGIFPFRLRGKPDFIGSQRWRKEAGQPLTVGLGRIPGGSRDGGRGISALKLRIIEPFQVFCVYEPRFQKGGAIFLPPFGTGPDKGFPGIKGRFSFGDTKRRHRDLPGKGGVLYEDAPGKFPKTQGFGQEDPASRLRFAAGGFGGRGLPFPLIPGGGNDRGRDFRGQEFPQPERRPGGFGEEIQNIPGGMEQAYR